MVMLQARGRSLDSISWEVLLSNIPPSRETAHIYGSSEAGVLDACCLCSFSGSLGSYRGGCRIRLFSSAARTAGTRGVGWG